MSSPAIQWYPGHIAKAERELQEHLKRVDVVLEVRDARIPMATSHPSIPKWIGNKERVLVLNRVDEISPSVKEAWTTWYRANGEVPFFTDARNGLGVTAIAKAAKAAGVAVNERRRNRGMLPRPVRAVVIGFPNVGKSALINRLLKKRVAESARKPGVTRQLRWIRISDELELLDAPGIIPWKLEDNSAAIKLAICDDIGQAAYDFQRVAAAFVDLCTELDYGAILADRYQIPLADITGEDFVWQLAATKYREDKERSARQILNDYRIGNLGSLALELPGLSIS
jgi:ribosome biogenesis GTPase A